MSGTPRIGLVGRTSLISPSTQSSYLVPILAEHRTMIERCGVEGKVSFRLGSGRGEEDRDWVGLGWGRGEADRDWASLG